MEAFLASSQRNVTGDVRVHIEQGRVEIHGVRSPWSLMDARVGTYGEVNRLWSNQDARGFSNVYGLQGVLASRLRPRD